jgi:competence protein ComEA
MSDPAAEPVAAAEASPPNSLTSGNTPSAAVPSPAAAKSDTDDSAPLWLRRTDQVVVGTLLIALVVLLSIHWLRLSRWGTAPIEVTSQQPREYFYSLDINQASWVEWAQLEGIGEKLARRIVADRNERGPFRDARDIGRVRGIGPKLLDKLKPFLRGGTAEEVADR